MIACWVLVVLQTVLAAPITRQTITVEQDLTLTVLSPRNDILLTVEAYTKLRIWRLNTTSMLYIQTQNISNDSIVAAAVAPCGDAILLASRNGTLSLYASCINSSQFQLVSTIPAVVSCSDLRLEGLAVSQDISYAVTVSENNAATLWNLTASGGQNFWQPINRFEYSIETLLVGDNGEVGALTSNGWITYIARANDTYTIRSVRVINSSLTVADSDYREVIFLQPTQPSITLKVYDNTWNISNMQDVSGIDGRCKSSVSNRSVSCPTNTTAKKGLSKGGIIALAVAIPVGVLAVAAVVAVSVAAAGAAGAASAANAAQGANSNNQANGQHTSQNLHTPQQQPPHQPANQLTHQPAHQTAHQPGHQSAHQMVHHNVQQSVHQAPHAVHHAPHVGHAAHSVVPSHTAAGLSGGAIAGIVVGAVAGGAALGAIATGVAMAASSTANTKAASPQKQNSSKKTLTSQSEMVIQLDWT